MKVTVQPADVTLVPNNSEAEVNVTTNKDQVLQVDFTKEALHALVEKEASLKINSGNVILQFPNALLSKLIADAGDENIISFYITPTKVNSKAVVGTPFDLSVVAGTKKMNEFGENKVKVTMLVDKTSIKEENLQLASYNKTTSKWEGVQDSVYDEKLTAVSGTTTQFTIFSVVDKSKLNDSDTGGDNGNGGNGGTGGDDSGNDNGGAGDKSPSTGDNTPLGLWFILSIFSLGLGYAGFKYRHKF